MRRQTGQWLNLKSKFLSLVVDDQGESHFCPDLSIRVLNRDISPVRTRGLKRHVASGSNVTWCLGASAVQILLLIFLRVLCVPRGERFGEAVQNRSMNFLFTDFGAADIYVGQVRALPPLTILRTTD